MKFLSEWFFFLLLLWSWRFIVSRIYKCTISGRIFGGSRKTVSAIFWLRGIRSRCKINEQKLLQCFLSLYQVVSTSFFQWGSWNASLEIKNPSIRVIFPTIETVKNNRSGITASRRMLCFSEVGNVLDRGNLNDSPFFVCFPPFLLNKHLRSLIFYRKHGRGWKKLAYSMMQLLFRLIELGFLCMSRYLFFSR